MERLNSNSQFGGVRICGFSLLELLTVGAIIAILLALSGPAINTLLRGSRLAQGGQLLSDQISLARSEAATRNRVAEFRIYRKEGFYRVFQIVLLDENMEYAEPLGRAQELPTGIVILDDPAFSPLLHDPHSRQGSSASDGPLSGPYRAIRFRPTGALGHFSTNFPFLTLAEEGFATKPNPDNVFVIQLDPLSGNQTIFRP